MQHTVRRGECMTSIAARHGFADYRNIYEDPANAALKAKRPNPNLLFPGDIVAIPERKPTIFECETGKTHTFELKPRKRMLRIRLEEKAGVPITDVPAMLIVSSNEKYETTSDKDGILKFELPLQTKRALLQAGGIVRQIRIGDLNPLQDAHDGGVSGVQARLKNLGFFSGVIDGRLGPETEAALAAFRTSLPVDPGEGFDDLMKALEKAHGI
jgi:hypothetical protein